MKNKILVSFLIGLFLVSSIVVVIADNEYTASVSEILLTSMNSALINPTPQNLIYWAIASINAKHEIQRLENLLQQEKNKKANCNGGSNSPSVNIIDIIKIEEENNWCDGADVNQDGVVNLDDLTILKEEFEVFKDRFAKGEANLDDLTILKEKMQTFKENLGRINCGG